LIQSGGIVDVHFRATSFQPIIGRQFELARGVVARVAYDAASVQNRLHVRDEINSLSLSSELASGLRIRRTVMPI